MHRSIEHIQASVVSLDKALSEGEDKWFYHGYKHINIHLPHGFQHAPALSSYGHWLLMNEMHHT